MCTAPGGENARQTPSAERHGGERVVVGKGCQHHVAGGDIGEARGGAGAGQSRCPLRLAVIDRHLITVFDQIDGKSVSHMAETDHADTFDGETGRRLAL
jgi:hypothetical protein